MGIFEELQDLEKNKKSSSPYTRIDYNSSRSGSDIFDELQALEGKITTTTTSTNKSTENNTVINTKQDNRSFFQKASDAIGGFFGKKKDELAQTLANKPVQTPEQTQEQIVTKVSSVIDFFADNLKKITTPTYKEGLNKIIDAGAGYAKSTVGAIGKATADYYKATPLGETVNQINTGNTSSASDRIENYKNLIISGGESAYRVSKVGVAVQAGSSVVKSIRTGQDAGQLFGGQDIVTPGASITDNPIAQIAIDIGFFAVTPAIKAKATARLNTLKLNANELNRVAKTLEVAPDASIQEISQAFKAKVKEYNHVFANQGTVEEIARVKELNNAYNTLKKANVFEKKFAGLFGNVIKVEDFKGIKAIPVKQLPENTINTLPSYAPELIKNTKLEGTSAAKAILTTAKEAETQGKTFDIIVGDTGKYITPDGNRFDLKISANPIPGGLATPQVDTLVSIVPEVPIKEQQPTLARELDKKDFESYLKPKIDALPEAKPGEIQVIQTGKSEWVDTQIDEALGRGVNSNTRVFTVKESDLKLTGNPEKDLRGERIMVNGLDNKPIGKIENVTASANKPVVDKLPTSFSKIDREKLINAVNKNIKISDVFNPSQEEIQTSIDYVDTLKSGLLKAEVNPALIQKAKALRARLNEKLFEVSGANVSSNYKVNYKAYMTIRGTDIPQAPLIEKIESTIDDLNKLIKNEGNQIAQLAKIEGDSKLTQPVISPNSIDEIPGSELKPSQLPVGQGKIRESRLFERTKEALDAEYMVTYNRTSNPVDSENAISYLQRNPNEAVRVALGLVDTPAGLLDSAVSIATANALRDQGKTVLANQIFSSLTLRRTRSGQENQYLATVDSNDPYKYISEVGGRRLTNIGANLKSEVISAVSKEQSSAKANAIRKIDKQTEVLQKEVREKVKKEMSKIDFAQAFIDSLTCK